MNEPQASCLPVVRGDHGRVALAALLPLMEWRYAGEPAEFRINDSHHPGTVSLVVIAEAPDSRYDSGSERRYGWGADRNIERSPIEALHKCAPDYATVEEALDQFRRVARLLVLHEVDETLRFAGMLPFDPHTKERDRLWPGTEELP